MIGQGLPIYVALEPVDMRLGYERLGGMVRERMQAEPRSKALFVFVGKRGHTMKVLTWDGTGAIVFNNPATGDYNGGSATVKGSITSPVYEVPYGSEPTLAFDVRLDTEFAELTSADFQLYLSTIDVFWFDRLAVYEIVIIATELWAYSCPPGRHQIL